MDITEALKITENDLRDLLFSQLQKQFGEAWIDRCGVTNERILKWKEKQFENHKRLKIADPRILYYADFYDLKTIVIKNWDKCFKEVFDNQKEFDVLLSILEEYRNPDAHRRELLPYQKNLAIGISGKIRTQITSYFSKLETGESYYPRIESAQDSLGSSYSLNLIDNFRAFKTTNKLRPGNIIEFVISAFDPMGEKILYAIDVKAGPHKEVEWKEDNNFSVEILDTYVGKSFWIFFAIKSNRKYHASLRDNFGEIDDEVRFGYEVLPPK